MCALDEDGICLNANVLIVGIMYLIGSVAITSIRSLLFSPLIVEELVVSVGEVHSSSLDALYECDVINAFGLSSAVHHRAEEGLVNCCLHAVQKFRSVPFDNWHSQYNQLLINQLIRNSLIN